MPAGQLTRLHIELPYRQTYDSQFWFRFRNNFGESKHSHISRFFTLPWATRLEHCHLNFQQDHGQPTNLDNLISVFTAPRLKSLVLVGVEFSSNILDSPQVYADGLARRGSSVQRLSLHHCCVPPKASEMLLSMPRSLRYLSYSTDGWGHGRGDEVDARTILWENVFAMCKQLGQQKDTLVQLDLDLGGLSDVESYERGKSKSCLSHLTSLTELTIKNRSSSDPEDGRMLLDRLPQSLRRLSICNFPYATDGEAMVIAAEYYLTRDLSTNIGFQEPAKQSALDDQCKRISKHLPKLEEFSISLTDDENPGTIAERLRRCFEYLGDRYRRELGWRFIVNRITEMRGAVPPYLWDEHVVDFIKVYDNMADNSLWDSKSGYEIKEEAERERLAEIARLEHVAQEERERSDLEDARRLGLPDSVSPPSPPPSISPVSGSLSQSVATASPANMAVVGAAMAMANANMNAVLGGLDS